MYSYGVIPLTRGLFAIIDTEDAVQAYYGERAYLNVIERGE